MNIARSMPIIKCQYYTANVGGAINSPSHVNALMSGSTHTKAYLRKLGRAMVVGASSRRSTDEAK